MFARAGTAATATSSRAAKGTASIEQFFWSTLSTDNDSCLSKLEAKLTVEMRRFFEWLRLQQKTPLRMNWPRLLCWVRK
jgi:hypothetical protein